MSDDLYDALDHTELWNRLIDGDCARVVILSPRVGRSMLELYFPQTLGLPPLRCVYYRSTPENLAAEATSLAVSDRWIAEGEMWIQHFLPHADAIISMETARIAMMALPARRMSVDLGTLQNWIRRERAARRERKGFDRAEPSVLGLALESQARSTVRAMKPISLSVAEEYYPDKLIRVSSGAQVRALRRVRAKD